MVAEINLIRLYENIRRPPLPTRINFEPSIDKLSHAQRSVAWNNLSIAKLQRLNRWNLGMDK